MNDRRGRSEGGMWPWALLVPQLSAGTSTYFFGCQEQHIAKIF